MNTRLPRCARATAAQLAAGVIALAAGWPSPDGTAARADTILWAIDSRGSPGPLLDEWDINEAAGTGTLVNSFTAPNAAAQGRAGGGIAIVGDSIYYSVNSSGAVFLTTASGADLGIAFNTGLSGIGSIASDGQFLYLTPSSTPNSSPLGQSVLKYTLGGALVSATVMVPSTGPEEGSLGRTGLEIVGSDFIANQGDNEGPYDRFAADGTLLAAEFLKGTDDFGFTGVAFDGTFYYVADLEDDPSVFRAFDASGNLLKELALTGCPAPNHICAFQDLAVAVAPVSEPATLSLLAAAMAGWAFCRPRRRRADKEVSRAGPISPAAAVRPRH